ncbi:hypothetical protein GCM10010411_74890 [Actinomadura fulvescens]|uniref:Uncharacterized protein n=1 Tax=Actinomadura fulvescens TaxID=46160 RepID=A0ABP6CYM5_9ACTN
MISETIGAYSYRPGVAVGRGGRDLTDADRPGLAPYRRSTGLTMLRF